MIGATEDGLANLPARQQRDEVLDVIVMRMAEDRHVDAGGTDPLERGVDVFNAVLAGVGHDHLAADLHDDAVALIDVDERDHRRLAARRDHHTLLPTRHNTRHGNCDHQQHREDAEPA